MTFLGIAGIMLGLIAAIWMTGSYTNRKIGFFALIAALHVITAVVYYEYVQANDADTKLYYFDPYGFRYNEFELGTIFLINMVQSMRDWLGGTYLDYFLVFQAFGLWGIALLVRTLEELATVMGRTWPPLFTVMLFMPGMYFWTSAIGKDAPLFFACALSLWATMSISRRWIWFALAVGIMVLFRLHVALVAVAALALAVMTGRGIGLLVRVLLLAGMGPLIYALIGTIQTSLKLNLSSVGSIVDSVNSQASSLANAAAENGALADQSVLIKLVSLLYRPFFVDAGGVFGLVASIQNIFMLYATYILLAEWRTWRAMFRQSLPIRFATCFFAAMVLMLVVMYYNVGLGLRQREMFTPALYLLFAAVYLVRNARLAQEQAGLRWHGGAVPLRAGQ